MMRLSDLASIGSLISSAAVVISLVYLALQIRQAERNQRALIHQGRASRMIALTTQIADPGIVDGYFLAIFGSDSITHGQYRQYTMIFTGLLYAIEDDFFQYKAGLLEKKYFESSTQTWKRIFSLPGHRVTWRRIRAVFAPEFVEFMDRTMGEVPAIQPVDDFLAWKADLLAEMAAARVAN
jgi:hypothetical protein